jgi:uncharacterized protein YbjT (DUF2867 family)
MRVLLTGATGFIGRRLLPALLAAGHEVRAATRDLARAGRAPAGVEWVRCDLDEPATVAAALQGQEAVIYLVHGMGGGARDYAGRELRQARTVAEAAAAAGLRRIVYLGGLAPPPGGGSRHLAARLAVGEALRAGTVPCLELRCSIVIGHGSASFGILRDLAARLPAMVLPAWLEHRTEPVAADDVIAALLACLALPLPASAWHDLPGPELLSGKQILLRTAAVLGVRPFTVGVPFITPRLSVLWLRFVSGVDQGLARELVDGLRTDLPSQDQTFRGLAGLPPATPFDEAVRRALAEERAEGGRPSASSIWERVVPRLAGRR